MNNNSRKPNNRRPNSRGGVKSAAEIRASIKASGIKDDDETTGPMGIRDSKALRENAASLLRKPKKKKK